MTTSEVFSLLSVVVAIASALWVAHSSSKKNNADVIRRIIILETQMEPLWNIIEDSVLKSVIHNPLTLEERAALQRYHARKSDVTREDLEVGKAGLQRELKALEEDPTVPAESTIPYVLTLVAIDRRLKLYDNE